MWRRKASPSPFAKTFPPLIWIINLHISDNFLRFYELCKRRRKSAKKFPTKYASLELSFSVRWKSEEETRIPWQSTTNSAFHRSALVSWWLFWVDPISLCVHCNWIKISNIFDFLTSSVSRLQIGSTHGETRRRLIRRDALLTWASKSRAREIQVESIWFEARCDDDANNSGFAPEIERINLPLVINWKWCSYENNNKSDSLLLHSSADIFGSGKLFDLWYQQYGTNHMIACFLSHVARRPERRERDALINVWNWMPTNVIDCKQQTTLLTSFRQMNA